MVLRYRTRKKRTSRGGGGGEEDSKNTIGDFRDWEALPEGLLDLILQRLQLLDCLSFSKVCKSWRNFYKQGFFFFNNQQARIPWLMMIDQHCSILRIGYSIMEDVCSQLEHPDFRWRTIWGSFQDWLILLNKDYLFTYDICLLNPFSRQRLYLPKLTGIYGKLLLSSSPCHINCIFVLVGLKVAFWIRAVPTWRELCVRGAPYVDGVFSQGCFYIRNKDFTNVVVYDIQGLEVKSSNNIPITMLVERIPRSWQSYMVESGNDVLLVYQYFNHQRETEHMDVCRLDGGGEEAWVEVESLGDRVLFIGRNCSTSSSTEDLGIGMANCIFFPYTHKYEYDYRSSSFRIDKWGIFDMDKQHVKHFASCPSSNMVGATWLSAPAWWYSTSSRGMAMRRQPQRRKGVKRIKCGKN